MKKYYDNKVSILIPLYNSEKFIAETITSALAQTWENKELIIVDDGSTDKSFEIAKSFESDIVRLYRQENRGASTARNVAFTYSNGDYIQYLDADDLISPDKIEAQMKLFEQFGNDILVSCQWDGFINSADESKFPNRSFYKDWDNPIDFLINLWNRSEMVAPHCWLVPRKIIEITGSWNEKITVNDDGEFFCRVMLNAKAIKFCEKAYAYYRISMDGLSLSKRVGYKSTESLLFSFEMCEKHILEAENSFRVKNALRLLYSYFIYSYCLQYPALCEKAKGQIKNMGFRAPSYKVGKKFKFIAFLIGFEAAVRLRLLIKKW